MATIGGANWRVTSSGRAAPRAAAGCGPAQWSARFTSGKAIMRTSVRKWERSQNFAGKHGTIYCFHIRGRVLQSWMQFVNPLSRSAEQSCVEIAYAAWRRLGRRGEGDAWRDGLQPAGKLALGQRSVFLLLANGVQTHRSVFIARKAFIANR